MKHCAPRNRVSEANSLTDGTHFPKHQFTFVEQKKHEIKAIIHQETENPIKKFKQIKPTKVNIAHQETKFQRQTVEHMVPIFQNTN